MLTFDHVVTAVYSSVLNPWLTIPLVAAYGYAKPEELSVVLKKGSRGYRPEITAISGSVKKCAYIILYSISVRLVNILNKRALNNGVSDAFNWDEEMVVVTGGAGGIGGDMVKQLASKGTKIAVLDVMPLTYSKPANVEYFKCDLTNADSLTVAADQIREKWGNPTVLCCIAGVVRGKPLLDLNKRDLDLTFGVNTIGVAMCYKEFVPSMVKANHGHVVTMASATAYLAVAGMVDYAASKSATLALHEGLQSELKNVYNAPKVRCTVLCPSIVATKMFTGLSTSSQFFNPILTSQQVAGAAVSAIWAGEARHIELPWLSKFMQAQIRSAPSFFRIGIQDGGKNAMTTFSGHKTMD
ncbi:hypothetical protein HBI09_183880 [Parastagonospora nodorum]|nr:hypothetical protein HBI09_183880 [Parastagonospora nodorum]KAH5000674.1 hypothetical protein HBI77_154160 [Parastagonospora nodorum]